MHKARATRLKARALSFTAVALGSAHEPVQYEDGWWMCWKCLQRCRGAERRQLRWMRSECALAGELVRAWETGRCKPCSVPAGTPVVVGGHTIHSSHDLKVFKGLVFCSRCAHYATQCPRRLKVQCEGFVKTGCRTVLSRLKKGELPPGLERWPNEAAHAVNEIMAEL